MDNEEFKMMDNEEFKVILNEYKIMTKFFSVIELKGIKEYENFLICHNLYKSIYNDINVLKLLDIDYNGIIE